MTFDKASDVEPILNEPEEHQRLTVAPTVNKNTGALIAQMKEFICGMERDKHRAWAKTAERLCTALEASEAARVRAERHIRIECPKAERRYTDLEQQFVAVTAERNAAQKRFEHSAELAAERGCKLSDLEQRLGVARDALSYPRYGTTAGLLREAADLLDKQCDGGWQSYTTPHLHRAAKAIDDALAQLDSAGITVTATYEMGGKVKAPPLDDPPAAVHEEK